MSRDLLRICVRLGAFSEERLQEFRRWGVPLEDIPKPLPQVGPTSLEDLSRELSEALEDEGMVIIRETNLTILQQYLATQQEAELFVTLDDAVPAKVFEVSVGKTELGEIIIPWRSEGIEALMTNGLTHLVLDGIQVFFCSVRELYFGDNKAFMVCTPSPPNSESDYVGHH